jgi:hypothetical protein
MQIHPAEMLVTEHPSGILEVNDPLFEEPYRIGDRSLIEDPVTDDFVCTVWDYYGIHMSTRQLHRTERDETYPGSGRWNRMHHTFGAVAITAHYGGTPQQLAEMAVHDLGHRIGSHRYEHVIDNRIADNDHEAGLPAFFRRSGFVDALVDRGLCDEAGVLKNGMALEELAHSEHNETGITNWPSKTGYPETERLNYILTEKAIWQSSPAEARHILQRVQRDPDSPYGDQLVFSDFDAAVAYTKAQMRCRTENWTEPVTQVSEELMVTMMRYALTLDTPEMESYSLYHPGDSLRALEEDWQTALVGQAHTNAGVRGIMKVFDKLTDWRRRNARDVPVEDYCKYGPLAPDWLTITRSLTAHSKQYVRGIQRPGGRYVVINVQPSKPRPTNPLVGAVGGPQDRLLSLDPDLKRYLEQKAFWCENSFDAVIDISSGKLGLSRIEQQGFMRAISGEARHAWQAALKRPLMSQEVLTQRITEAGQRCRRLGAVSVAQAA